MYTVTMDYIACLKVMIVHYECFKWDVLPNHFNCLVGQQLYQLNYTYEIDYCDFHNREGKSLVS